MHQEREELVKFVFPRLRKLCESREVVWGEVDLRWGVTDEQVAEGQVLPICLEEIKRCRPYFIGLLGERYGWVPKVVSPDVIESEPWLEEHFHGKKSVTELEILHGVLLNPEMAEHAFFYFRDSDYLNHLPAGSDIADFTSDTPESRVKLAELKQRIRDSKFRFHEDYADPKELGELVLQDLTAVIDQLFPDGSQPDPLDREAMDHEAFARSRERVYVGRLEYFERLNAHANSTGGKPLVILGESGSGKSALLANWAIKYREAHADDLVVMHFIGASPYSNDWTVMLRRIMGEFKRRFDIPQEIPDQADDLRMAFANFLNMASAQGRVVLIIDALNQLEDRDGAPDLVWLPLEIPANIRLIISTLSGRPQDEVLRREWQTLQVEALKPEERWELIDKYLERYSKRLNADRVKRIEEADQTANPLYLCALLEELRVFGIYEQLDQRIQYYLSAPTVECLYQKILERYEEDYDRDRPGLVRDSMSLLWGARRGLSEAELLEMLGSDQGPLPRAYWSPLYLAADQSLVSRSGMVGFFHDYFRQAVYNRYVPTKEKQQTIHLHLANYFLSRENSRRRVDELPWQFAEAESWQRLYDLLADMAFFQDAWQADQFDVKEYWARVENRTALRLVDAYRPIVEKPKQVSPPDSLIDLARFLKDTGHLNQSLALWTHLVEYHSSTGEGKKLALSLGNLAVIIRILGDPDKALKMHEEEERICRELGDKEGLHRCLGNQALILRIKDQLDKAMVLHKQEEYICRELKDKNGLSICLGNQGEILFIQNNLDAAIAKFKEQEEICRELGNKDGLLRIYANQALIHKARGELDIALDLLEKQEIISRQLGNKYRLQQALGNQAAILFVQGNLEKAMEKLKEQENLCREIGEKYSLQLNLDGQAQIHLDRKEFDEAMPLLEEQEKINRELDNQDGLQHSLYHQALIYMNQQKYELALSKLSEHVCILRELEGRIEDLARSLVTEATLLAKEMNRPHQALPLAEEAYHLLAGRGQTELMETIKEIMRWIRSLL